MISFDNLFEFKEEELGISKEKEMISLISHAHTDHLPSRFTDNHIVSSQITKKLMQMRRKVLKIKSYKCKEIKMLDAGHILGSKMFLVKDLLYTGDFNTENSFCGKAKPIKCKKLIMESTFGNPKYVFPERKEVLKEMNEYIEENEKVILMSIDSFGKPQEMCSALDKMKIPFTVNDKIKKVNDHLGLKFKHESDKAGVVLTDKYSSMFFSSEYKRVFLTGWNATNRFNFGSEMDKGFVFSNHCDYPSLIEFVKKCNPEKIYTHHGYVEEFAYDLRKMGFDAAPLYNLVKRKNNPFGFRKNKVQQTLFNFFK